RVVRTSSSMRPLRPRSGEMSSRSTRLEPRMCPTRMSRSCRARALTEGRQSGPHDPAETREGHDPAAAWRPRDHTVVITGSGYSNVIAELDDRSTGDVVEFLFNEIAKGKYRYE